MMSKKQPDKECEVAFYFSNEERNSPQGLLYLEKDTLIVEFTGKNTTLRIPRTTALKTVTIEDDRMIRIDRPDRPGTSVHLFPDTKGQGRFNFYGIRSWLVGETDKTRTYRKRMFHIKFESYGAKFAILWQLAIPFMIYYLFFFIKDQLIEIQSEVTLFLDQWQQIVFSPYVAAHYVIFLIPAIAALFCNRLWGLAGMLAASLTWSAVIIVSAWLPQLWVILPNAGETLIEAAKSHTLIMHAYWVVMIPYLVFLLLPTFYYVIILRRYD